MQREVESESERKENFGSTRKRGLEHLKTSFFLKKKKKPSFYLNQTH